MKGEFRQELGDQWRGAGKDKMVTDEDDSEMKVSDVGSFSFAALYSSRKFLLQSVKEKQNG